MKIETLLFRLTNKERTIRFNHHVLTPLEKMQVHFELIQNYQLYQNSPVYQDEEDILQDILGEKENNKRKVERQSDNTFEAFQTTQRRDSNLLRNHSNNNLKIAIK